MPDADYRDCLDLAGAIAGSVECYEGDDLLGQIIPHLKPVIGLLEVYRRYHSKIGCPGPEDCYVCRAEEDYEEKSRRR